MRAFFRGALAALAFTQGVAAFEPESENSRFRGMVRSLAKKSGSSSSSSSSSSKKKSSSSSSSSSSNNRYRNRRRRCRGTSECDREEDGTYKSSNCKAACRCDSCSNADREHCDCSKDYNKDDTHCKCNKAENEDDKETMETEECQNFYESRQQDTDDCYEEEEEKDEGGSNPLGILFFCCVAGLAVAGAAGKKAYDTMNNTGDAVADVAGNAVSEAVEAVDDLGGGD